MAGRHGRKAAPWGAVEECATGAMGGNKDGSGLHREDGEDNNEADGWQWRRSRVQRGLRQRRAIEDWSMAIVVGVGLPTIDKERRWWSGRGGSGVRQGLRQDESNGTGDNVASSR
ncbi:hypothetical protein B296_00035181 [Ensete ventricosum]|uniref:Uncharacterized protein n=1 Tax=Ensete ventricosum TaxID=4639 RepID=A0A426ZL35_ENSVE|nr:hypothetical protein B296_00035181 [Ensete ventricosum]